MLEAFTRDQLLQAPPAFTHRRAVAFQEIDAAGIVFFPNLLVYMHDAYVAFLDAAGCPLHQVIAEGEWIAPIGSTAADFLRPLRFGDAIAVSLVAARRGRSSLRLGYRVDRGEEPIAVGQTTHVFLAAGRATPIPAPVQRALAAFQEI